MDKKEPVCCHFFRVKLLDFDFDVNYDLVGAAYVVVALEIIVVGVVRRSTRHVLAVVAAIRPRPEGSPHPHAHHHVAPLVAFLLRPPAALDEDRRFFDGRVALRGLGLSLEYMSK